MRLKGNFLRDPKSEYVELKIDESKIISYINYNFDNLIQQKVREYFDNFKSFIEFEKDEIFDEF